MNPYFHCSRDDVNQLLVACARAAIDPGKRNQLAEQAKTATDWSGILTEEIIALLSTAYEQPVEAMSVEVTSTLQQFHKHRAIEYPGEEKGRQSG